jgi:hypothetical protein
MLTTNAEGENIHIRKIALCGELAVEAALVNFSSKKS